MTGERRLPEDLFHSLPGGCLVTSSSGTILEANRAAAILLGCEPEALRQKPLASFFGDEDLRQFSRLLLRIEREPDLPDPEIEVCLKGPRGRPFPASLRAGALREEGRPARLLWLLRDVSGQKEVQERALELARMEAVSLISKGLVHASSNALQVIVSGLEMLTAELKGHPEPLTLIRHIKESQESLGRLFEKFREYTSPIRLELRENHLGEILEEAWAQLEPLRRGRRARLGEWESGRDLRCRVDRGETEKLYRSILENSLWSSPDPVEIEVEWSAGEIEGREAIILALHDRGIRIPAEEKGAFFEPFRKIGTGGAGLDLAIARRIARAQGGDIGLADRAAGGQAILVTLPREPPDRGA